MGGIYNSSPVLLYIFCTFVNRTQLFIVGKLLLEPFFYIINYGSISRNAFDGVPSLS